MVPDINVKVTPDLKNRDSVLLLVAPAWRVTRSAALPRLGGSALAQVLDQLSDDCPDLEDPEAFADAFRIVQALLDSRSLLAGHDVSDGGLLSTVLEMAFAGNMGCAIELEHAEKAGGEEAVLRTLFGEELGWVLQVDTAKALEVIAQFAAKQLGCVAIGSVVKDGRTALSATVNGQHVLQNATVAQWRDVWESTSFAMEKRQCAAECVAQEEKGLTSRQDPPYKLTYVPTEFAFDQIAHPPSSRPRMACIREEGTNGDREMAGAFFAAGFDVWDVSMDDLKMGRIGLDAFRGVAFTGGFSFADVFGSAKGWGAGVRLNQSVREEFARFKARPDTFSLGVCNGCQLMALLGWVGPEVKKESSLPRFVHNSSGRFESRFSAVKIEQDTPAMMLKDMGGSVLGVWVAHGEGQVSCCIFTNSTVIMDSTLFDSHYSAVIIPSK
jgi:phosphoribosylformylglycinamidine synthase